MSTTTKPTLLRLSTITVLAGLLAAPYAALAGQGYDDGCGHGSYHQPTHVWDGSHVHGSSHAVHRVTPDHTIGDTQAQQAQRDPGPQVSLETPAVEANRVLPINLVADPAIDVASPSDLVAVAEPEPAATLVSDAPSVEAVPVAPAPVAPSAKPAPVVDPAGSFVTVAFLPTITASDISIFAKAYDVAIVGGPTTDGAYRIRLSTRPLPQIEVERIVASMRTQVNFVSAVRDA